MKMTRAHFRLIAEVIKDCDDSINNVDAWDATKHSAIRMVADEMSGRLCETNPLFNRSKFMEACGFPE